MTDPAVLSLPVLVTVIVAIVVVVLPGLSVLAAAGIGRMRAAALAGPVTVALVGGAGVLLAAIGVRFAWWSVAVVLVVVAAVVLGARLLLRRIAVHRRARRASGPGRDAAAHGAVASAPPTADAAAVAAAAALPRRAPGWAIAASWLAGAAIVAAVVLPALGSGGAVSPTYDGVFHLNAAASILDDGDASSFHLYRLNNPGDDLEFYPAAWHSLVALVAGVTGAGIPLATNAVWIAVAVAVWIPGAAWLTAVVAPVAHRRVALLAAPVLAAAFAGFPYLLLDWGTLYPTGLAYALVPAGLALLVQSLRLDPAAAPVRHPHPASTALAVVWLAAAVFAHPRSIISVAVIAVLVLAIPLARELRARLRDPATRRRALAVLIGGAAALVAGVAAVSVAVLLYFDVASRPIEDRLNGGPARASQTVAGAIVQAIGLGPVSSPSEQAVAPSIGLAVLTLAGLVIAARTRGLAWIPLAFAAFAVLYVLAASSDGAIAKVLTGFWYKDKYRLISVLPVLAVPAASLAVAAGLRWLQARVPRPGARRLIAVVAGVAVAASAVPALAGISRATADIFSVPAAAAPGRLLDADELALLRRLPDLVPATDAIAGDPWDGSALTWAVGERRSLFPHLTGDWGADRGLVATGLDRAATDPEVCAALDRLGARWLFTSDGRLGGENPDAEFYAGLDRAPAAPGFTEVAREGGSALYRIDACD
jgi:hypothetical protein